MKSPLTTLTEMTTIGWSILLGNQPNPAALTPAGKAAKLAPVQEWEDEGGNVKEVPTPRARKAAPAKKSKSSRTAKVKKRK